jgi:hypothetical protein
MLSFIFLIQSILLSLSSSLDSDPNTFLSDYALVILLFDVPVVCSLVFGVQFSKQRSQGLG